MKKIVSLLLVVVLMASALSACGTGPSEQIIGKWYNSKGKCLDVRSDGSWKLEGSYGTGRWKVLDDKETVEFTDFYGDTQETKIYEDESGVYIDFGHYGDFYKEA